MSRIQQARLLGLVQGVDGIIRCLHFVRRTSSRSNLACIVLVELNGIDLLFQSTVRLAVKDSIFLETLRQKHHLTVYLHLYAPVVC